VRQRRPGKPWSTVNVVREISNTTPQNDQLTSSNSDNTVERPAALATQTGLRPWESRELRSACHSNTAWLELYHYNTAGIPVPTFALINSISVDGWFHSEATTAAVAPVFVRASNAALWLKDINKSLKAPLP